MNTKNNLTVLERYLNEYYETYGNVFPKESIPYLRKINRSFAEKAIREDRKKRRSEMVQMLRPLPRMFYLAYFYFIRAKIRKWFFNRALKTAMIESLIQNRKIWIVQSSMFTYTLISSKDFKNGKKVRVFKKDLTFKDMDEVAELTVFPKHNKVKL